MQHEFHEQQYNTELQTRVQNLRKKVVYLSEAERDFCYQKAKCIYLKNCDKCTKFFHAIVKRNSKENYIAAVSRENGTFTTSI